MICWACPIFDLRVEQLNLTIELFQILTCKISFKICDCHVVAGSWASRAERCNKT